MWIHTLRGRLTFWNAAILSLTLVAFGLVLNFTNQRRLSQQIDLDLLMRARQATHRPPRPPNDGGGPPPRDFGGEPQGQNVDAPPIPGDPNPDDDNLEHLAGPPEGPGPAGNNMSYLRRPEIVAPDGAVVAPRNHPELFDSKSLAAALGGAEVVEDGYADGIPIRAASIPIVRHGKVIGVVETARDVSDFQSLWRGQTVSLLLLVPLALIAGGIGAFFLANKALRPVGEATATAARISGEDLSARLPVRGADELAQLSSTFNAMLGRIEESFAKQQKAYEDLEKSYETQRRFTGDASHELRTPLTRLKLATSSALSESGLPAPLLESLRIADQSADSMSKIVQQLLLLSRSDAGQLQLARNRLDLRVVAAEAADTFVDRNIQVCLPDEPVLVDGDEDHLKRVFLNLLHNSIRHTPPDKPIRLQVLQEGSNATATVTDAGEGIAPEHLPHLGERFFRVDAARSREDGGFGLGLSICKSILDSLGGTMEIRSELGRGTEVRLSLPVSASRK